jgi:hypothetical protein
MFSQQYLSSLADVEDTMAKQMAQIKELQVGQTASTYKPLLFGSQTLSQLQATLVKTNVDTQVRGQRFATDAS